MAFVRFLVVGVAGFLVDAGITVGLIALGLAPWVARIPGIALAMGFTWLANRRFAFSVQRGRTIGEAARYALVAISMAAVNYLGYLGFIRLGLPAAGAIVVSTLLQAILSFHAYRRFVFS